MVNVGRYTIHEWYGYEMNMSLAGFRLDLQTTCDLK